MSDRLFLVGAIILISALVVVTVIACIINYWTIDRPRKREERELDPRIAARMATWTIKPTPKAPK